MSEMVAIPNTLTLVAEENTNRPVDKIVVKDLIQPDKVVHHPTAAAAARPQQHHRVSVREKVKEETKDRLPQSGDSFMNDKGEKFVLNQKLGDGAMGHVFLSVYDQHAVAIKVEKHSMGMLPMEIKVTLSAMRDESKHFCRIFDYGTVRKEFNYMVISLLGKDLYRLRSERESRSFTLNTTTKIALETMEAIEELHHIGYLSRDVKPSNFAPGLRENCEHKTIFMFDFGLAKRYLDRENRKFKSRGEVGWRGTIRYASLNAHKRLDLGRRDDIECWFYMLVEMHVGELPWRFLTDRSAVNEAKKHIREVGRAVFFSRLPRQFEPLLAMIDAYNFETRPEYKKLKLLINEIRAEHKLSDRQSWDWQTEESELSDLTETMSLMSDDAIMAEQGATNYTDRIQG